MSVNLTAPSRESLKPVAGITLGIAQAGVKNPGEDDLVVINLPEGASLAGVFTQNRFAAAPIISCRKRMHSGVAPRALVINTGNANAGTGRTGEVHAESICSALAEKLGVSPMAVWPFSTGVIMEPLPFEKIIDALPAALNDADERNWAAAAAAIMTTDTTPKGHSVVREINGNTVTVTGIAKGSGMIEPNMATMLAYIAVDATIPKPVLQVMLAEIADNSFNRVTVDGDTSTNDAFMLIANNRPDSLAVQSQADVNFAPLRDAIAEVAVYLAQALARDGEGATRFITIEVSGGKTRRECRQVGKAIANSPLVKTAMFAGDPNLGRILAAVGYAGIDDLDISRVSLWLGDLRVVTQGGRDPEYIEARAAEIMAESEITMLIELDRGEAVDQVWTCDFSYDYVRINAEYRS
ncbi:MAG TPA: bifunctional glutamate N-acetyltransferase/amino-acid acetyltransferase ArgJ [Halothiobacillaceae bacterium]|nr:bifunctional glutamate N-acetyltransferase/amino-acid acetyltransferase ArgJ [Halothiobacillaceae bacterium]